MTKPSLPQNKTTFLASLRNPGKVRAVWLAFQKLPLGKMIFSKIMGWVIPYTGQMSASVQKIEPGYAEVQLRDRRKVRNHLNSVHAIALANVGEYCCGLALFSQSPPNAQAILVKLACTYLKKARGLLTASSHFEVTEFQTDTEYPLIAEIKDSNKDIVAIVNTTWRVRLLNNI